MGHRKGGGRRRAQRVFAAFSAAAFMAAALWGAGAFGLGLRTGQAGADGARPAPRVVFSAADPAGDDRGAGELSYPTHRAFDPHAGLFDLRRFRVSVEDRLVHVDLTFGEITNPFSAPEGFYHQRVDVYFVTSEREGNTRPFRPGPRVEFHRDFPWSLRLRVAPFGGTRLHTHQDPPDSPGRSRGITVGVRPDGKTIRVSIPSELLGVPRPDWRYYVLVGGYDHFGEDEWRDVVAGEDAWSFGVGEEDGTVPRVVDILAPARGFYSQKRQLGTVPRGSAYPVLRPMAPPGLGLKKAAAALAVLAFVGGAALHVRRRGVPSRPPAGGGGPRAAR